MRLRAPASSADGYGPANGTVVTARTGAGLAGGAWAKAAKPIKAVSMVVAAAMASAHAAGRAGAKTNR